MPSTKIMKQLAIVGGGVIGASWAAYYLARKFDMVGTLSDRTLECLFHYPGSCGTGGANKEGAHLATFFGWRSIRRLAEED